MPKLRRAPYKMRTFARGVIAGKGPLQALRESSYNTDGMSDKTLSRWAQKLLNNPLIAPAIQAAEDEMLTGAQMDRAELIDNLEAVVGTSIADLLEFRVIEVQDAHGRLHKQAIWCFKDSDELDPRQLQAVSEIGVDAKGRFRLRMEPKAPARALLTKLHGWEAAPKAPVGQDGKDVHEAIGEIVRKVID